MEKIFFRQNPFYYIWRTTSIEKAIFVTMNYAAPPVGHGLLSSSGPINQFPPSIVKKKKNSKHIENESTCTQFLCQSFLVKLQSLNLGNFGGSEFWFSVSFSYAKMQKFNNTKFQRCCNCQKSRFWDFRLTEINLMKNVSGRKMANFHIVL